MTDHGDRPGDPGGPALMEYEGEKARVVIRRVLRHSPDVVWAAITDPAQVGVWFMAKVSREGGVDGTIEMDFANGLQAKGRVLAWDPPKLYEYEWNVAPGPYSPEGEETVVRWELTPTKDGTLLLLIHRKMTRPLAQTFSHGLTHFTDRLTAHLDGESLPDPPWAPRT